MVAGVAAGLADAFGLDPNVVRCGFVVLSIASGLGVVLYGVGVGADAERRPSDAPRPESPGGDVVATVAFGAVVLGGLLLVRARRAVAGRRRSCGRSPPTLVGLALLAMRTTPSAADGRAARLADPAAPPARRGRRRRGARRDPARRARPGSRPGSRASSSVSPRSS